jgi:3-deoxy-manno-octulosonate cytidylyltransferase (CMP-KDO synthetase)
LRGVNLASASAPSPPPTLAVIPARLDASRLPRKPLRQLGGIPLVLRVWERVRSLAVAERCVVATDSAEVEAVARAAGAECVLTSQSHPSGTDRVAQVAAQPEFAQFRVILNVQGDEPFVPAEAVRGAAALVASGRFPVGTAAALVPPAALDSPHVVKVVCADDGRALYFSRAPIPFLRDSRDRAIRDGTARQHIGVYAYTPEALARWVSLPPHALELVERLEQLRPLAAGVPMGVAHVDETPRGGVDTEDDLLRANQDWPDFIAGRT